MGTDNPSSPFAAACTINVKRTPISENSPSLQLQFQKHRQPNKKNHIWCKFQFLESYRTSSPHQQSQQSSRLVGLLFVFIIACLFLMHVLGSAGGGGGGGERGGSLNVSFYNHRFCMFWYIPESKNCRVWVSESEWKSKNCRFCMFQKLLENPPLGFMKELAFSYHRSRWETETSA
jgi:hypothetical protein